MECTVQRHYQRYPYPEYPLIASVKRCDTYALNLSALWCRFNGALPPASAKQILLAGCGTFSPYPWSVANPDAGITALDLSERSLRRARLHCLLHGRTNVVYKCGSLLDDDATAGKYGLIDSYGVLHHLDNPLSGLKSLEKRLLPDGILRIMLYSRYARREEESIRRALRLLGVSNSAQARQLLKKAKAGSRLAEYMATTDEIGTDAGIADALLHPKVHTFRIDSLLDLIRQAGLKPLLFAHHGALENVQDEIQRLQSLEKERYSPGNFVLYLGRNDMKFKENGKNSMLVLNPCLTDNVRHFTVGTRQIPARIGVANPVIGSRERRFLRRFITPVPRSELTSDLTAIVDVYKRSLFLLEYRC